MKYEIDTFDSYFETSRKHEQELLETTSPVMDVLRSCHELFREFLSTERSTLTEIQSGLAMHACMTCLSAIRVSMSGHMAASYPLLRSALEASCYALQIGENPEHERVWVDRDDTPESLKQSRKIFGPAVRNAAKEAQKKSWILWDINAWIITQYDTSIDYGAHPNHLAILPHLQRKENRDGSIASIRLECLYKPMSTKTQLSLLHCLEYALVIATILLCCLDEPSENSVIEINQLNKLRKDILTRVAHCT